MSYRGPEGRSIHRDGAVGLGVLLGRGTQGSALQPQPTVGRSGRLLVWDGRLDEREDLLRRLSSRGHDLPTDAPDPALVVAALDEFGEEVLAGLIGDFAFAAFDPRIPELLLVRDGIGMRTLSFARPGDSVVFASDAKGLFPHPDVPRSPNDDLVAELLLNGWPQEDLGETFFRGVYDVAPGQVVRFTPEVAMRRTYWDLARTPALRLDSFESYADAFRERFESAVRRRLRSTGPVGVTVSGGLDSSSVLAVAARYSGIDAAADVFAVHQVGPDGGPADELAFAEEVDRWTGVAFVMLPVTTEGFRTWADEFVRLSETPFPVASAAVQRASFDAVRGGGARVLLTGFGGDQLLGATEYFHDLLRAGHWGTLVRHLRELPGWTEDVAPGYYRRTLFSGTARQLVPGVAQPAFRRMKALRRRRPGGDPWWTRRLVSLAFADPKAVTLPSVRRFGGHHARGVYLEIASKGRAIHAAHEIRLAAGHGLELAWPFMDRDVVSFLYAIPGEIASHGGVHRALLRHAMAGVIPPAVAGRRWKGDFTDLWNRSVYADAPEFLEDLRDGRAVRGGYVDFDAVAGAALAPPVPGGKTSGVASAFMLEAWLRTFFGDGRPT